MKYKIIKHVVREEDMGRVGRKNILKSSHREHQAWRGPHALESLGCDEINSLAAARVPSEMD